MYSKKLKTKLAKHFKLVIMKDTSSFKYWGATMPTLLQSCLKKPRMLQSFFEKAVFYVY